MPKTIRTLEIELMNAIAIIGRQYLFIKNSAVFRLECISEIVSLTTHYCYVPTGVYLGVKVKDENGSSLFASSEN